MTGWFKIYRSLFNKPIWLNSTTEQKVILITLIGMVNHQESEWEWKGNPYKVKPGQVVTSLESIVKKCGNGVTVAKVRTALNRFQKFGFLTNQSTNKNRLITIINWELYQINNGELTNCLTNNKQTFDKQLATNKKEKNKKNDEENYNMKIYGKESVPFKLSVMFLNKIRENFPDFREPNLQEWADVFLLMIEKDSLKVQQIEMIINWCQRDSFWQSRVLSPTKLRMQFSRLVVIADQKNQFGNGFSTKRPDDWKVPQPLTSDEYYRMKQIESELL